jgi:hypothetical protein
VKKKMYYNMKMETLRRTLFSLNLLVERMRLGRNFRFVRAMERAERKQLSSLDKEEIAREIERRDLESLSEQEYLRKRLQDCIARQMIELETGGNVRLEELKGNGNKTLQLVSQLFYNNYFSLQG